MEALILDLRRSRSLGVKGLRLELIRQHGLALSLNTIHRVLSVMASHLEQRRKGVWKYPRPSQRIVPGIYQFTNR